MRNFLFAIIVLVSVTTNVLAAEQVGKFLNECKNKNTMLYTHHVPHETDPHKFYKCLGSYGFLMDCPVIDGQRTIFYPAIQRCEKTKDGGPSETKPDCTQDTRNKPHKDCHRYYKCVNGVAEERECLPGHNFNPIIANCDIIQC